MDLKDLQYDEKLANDGVWVVIDTHTSVKLAMAKSCNKKYITLLRQYAKELLNAQEDEQLAEKILSRVLAETVLLDWKGLTFNGKAVEYSKQEAEYLLLTIPEFRELITQEASNVKHFQG